MEYLPCVECTLKGNYSSRIGSLWRREWVGGVDPPNPPPISRKGCWTGKQQIAAAEQDNYCKGKFTPQRSASNWWEGVCVLGREKKKNKKEGGPNQNQRNNTHRRKPTVMQTPANQNLLFSPIRSTFGKIVFSDSKEKDIVVLIKQERSQFPGQQQK